MRIRTISIAAYFFLFVVGLAGCDTSDPGSDELADISMEPDEATMSVGETTDFSIAGVTASGDIVDDPSVDLRWWSSDTTVFTVGENGLAVAQGEGTAYCKAEANTPSKAALRYVGRDSAFVTVFR